MTVGSNPPKPRETPLPMVQQRAQPDRVDRQKQDALNDVIRKQVMDPTAAEVDEKQVEHVDEPARRRHLLGEEVARSERRRVPLEDLAPAVLPPPPAGVQAVLLKDVLDRGFGDRPHPNFLSSPRTRVYPQAARAAQPQDRSSPFMGPTRARQTGCVQKTICVRRQLDDCRRWRMLLYE